MPRSEFLLCSNILAKFTYCAKSIILRNESKKTFAKTIFSHHLGFNFINAAFMHPDTKSAKKTVKSSSFFVLSGSACVKAARRMLMKLTHGLNLKVKLNIILHLALLCVRERKKDKDEIDRLDERERDKEKNVR